MSDNQIFHNDENGAMSFTPIHWESGYASSTIQEDAMQRPYAIQRFSNHPDDPYVASGIIPTPSPLDSQQAACTPNLYNLQQTVFSQSDVRRLSEHAANCVDSGYGGSHLSYSASSPSVRTGKTEETLSLKCMRCEYEAKNNSELRKHINRHSKPHKCCFRNCTKGFATQNDLDRHKRTVHRREFLDKRNTILYECLHCKDQRGKSNARKKTEWPRKDNFLAHLDRIHHIRYRPSDNLDQYVVRAQCNPEDLVENMAGTSDQAQRLALQGIGTGADAELNATHLPADFANELVPADQASDVYQEQRISMFMHRNSRVLADASVLGPFSQQELILPDMLNGHEYDLGVMSASLRIADDDKRLQQSQAQLSVQGGHCANSDASSFLHSWRATNQSDDDVPECDENVEYVSDYPQGSSSTGNATALASQHGPEVTATSSHTTGIEDPAFTPDGTVQPPSESMESEVILRLLRHVPRETLQAALDSRAPEGDERLAARIQSSTKSGLHPCPTCRKAFKRQCDLKDCLKSFGSKNDWKRHESKQHYNIESWVCREDGCGQEYNRRETFNMHLRTSHSISLEHVDYGVDRCRQGKHWDANFWCGFCVNYIEVDRDDGRGNAWSQRVDHIDDHFCGRGTWVKRGIEEWTYQEDMAVDFPGFVDETGCAASIAASQTASSLSASQKRLASAAGSESPDGKRNKGRHAMHDEAAAESLRQDLDPRCLS
ncbi:hypothetical protein E4U42_000212 [Claviceps africana]|uniref:C2H2-type domain-containing protein n=1 Tax=Claviceps africana TaxID=83212 RepID=A0A8K0NFN7_9HYPO|nr:hypothetical protein E4U42_000212 [Claviceps africana]